MTRWTHKSDADHPPDPHYNANGKPAWWTCHMVINKVRCDDLLLLDGKAPPITIQAEKGTKEMPESKMSAQP